MSDELTFAFFVTNIFY